MTGPDFLLLVLAFLLGLVIGVGGMVVWATRPYGGAK